MLKREIKKPLKTAHKNPFLGKLKAKLKCTLSRPQVRRHAGFQVIKSSK